MLLFIGEAPGYEENLMGEPLSGRAAMYLDKMLAAASISKNSISITNISDTQPKEGLRLSRGEVAFHKIRLWKEIKALSPKVIVTLGKTPTALLLKLKPTFKLKDVLGQFHTVEYMTATVAPWYHPDYLLNQGAKYDKATLDFLMKVKEQL